MRGKAFKGSSEAGLNWDNVSKRILPQLIYKGHVLRQEPLCNKGMFFVCPTPVYDRVRERLGGDMRPYHFQPGSLTFCWYDLGSETAPGQQRELVHQGNFTTTYRPSRPRLHSSSESSPGRRLPASHRSRTCRTR